ncbi:MAG: PDZ domain-containing protein [Acidobacteriota bacterium]
MGRILLISLSLLLLSASASAEPGYLGLGIDFTSAGAGVVKSFAEGSPCPAAGVLIGDVVETLDGQAVGSKDRLFRIARGIEAGDRVPIGIVRGSEVLEVTVTAVAAGEEAKGEDSKDRWARVLIEEFIDALVGEQGEEVFRLVRGAEADGQPWSISSAKRLDQDFSSSVAVAFGEAPQVAFLTSRLERSGPGSWIEFKVTRAIDPRGLMTRLEPSGASTEELRALLKKFSG